MGSPLGFEGPIHLQGLSLLGGLLLGRKLPEAEALWARRPLKPNQKVHYNYPELFLWVYFYS